MKNILRLIFGTLPPVLLGAAVVAYLVINKAPPKQMPVVEKITYVRSIRVQQTNVVPTVVGYGVVRPAKTWNGISQVGGKIVYVNPDFQKGASMTAGSEIVRLSPSDYNLAIAQAEANIRSTKARLSELDVNEENTKNSLQIEEQALALKVSDLERKQELLKNGSVAQSTVDVAQSTLLAQQQKVLGMKNSLKLFPTQKTVLDEQIAVYESALGTAKLNLERTSIKLPFDARVAEVKTEISQYLTAGQSIGTFDGVESAEIEAQIPIQQFGAMMSEIGRDSATPIPPLGNFSRILDAYRLTAIVRLKIGDLFVTWNGKVSRISDTIDPKTRTVGVIVTVADAYRGVRPGERPPLTKGMFVEVDVLGPPVRKALVVPRSAINRGSIPVVGDENRLEFRKVEVSLYQGDIAVVTAGLNEGEQVVVSTLVPAIPGMLLEATVDLPLEQKIKSQAEHNGEAR